MGLQCSAPPLETFTLPQHTGLRVVDRTFVLGDDAVARCDVVSRESGVSELKFFFARGEDSKLVPLSLASYVINSVVYGCTGDKSREPSRNWLLRVRDGDGQECKTRLQLDLRPPLIYFPPPAVSVSAFDFSVSVLVTGDYVYPGEKLVIGDVVPRGQRELFEEIRLYSREGAVIRLDERVLEREGNLSLRGKEVLGEDGILCFVIDTATPHELRFHLFESGFVKKEHLQGIFRAVALMFPRHGDAISAGKGLESEPDKSRSKAVARSAAHRASGAYQGKETSRQCVVEFALCNGQSTTCVSAVMAGARGEH
jgi:hypothetical protein